MDLTERTDNQATGIILTLKKVLQYAKGSEHMNWTLFTHFTDKTSQDSDTPLNSEAKKKPRQKAAISIELKYKTLL